MIRKAAIISIKGTKLSYLEKSLLKKEKPWGVILFKRNIVSFKQTSFLTKTIRKCMQISQIEKLRTLWVPAFSLAFLKF